MILSAYSARWSIEVTFENSLPSNHYTRGEVFGDNESLYAGSNDDTLRWAVKGSSVKEPRRDDYMENPPRADCRGPGSAQASGWHAAFCDGSVRFLSYSIGLMEVHIRLGNRASGLPVDAGKY